MTYAPKRSLAPCASCSLLFTALLAAPLGAASHPAVIELAEFDGSDGFVLHGVAPFDMSSGAVAGGGDINGDGIDDLLIGLDNAKRNDVAGIGQSYVVFGDAAGFPAILELSDLDGSNGFALNGVDGGDHAGQSIAIAGDVNGDGIDDLVIGAEGADQGDEERTGESYVVFGSRDPFPANFELASLDGSNGFALKGIDEGDASGRSVSAAGDFNGDGTDDLLIGAPSGHQGEDAGEAYVVFGRDGAFPASLELADLDGSDGVVLAGADRLDACGYSVAGVGDVNGDGIDDVLIGAYLADPNGVNAAGESYLVFGSREPFPASLELASLDGSNGVVLTGTAAIDFSGISVGAAGDINGDGLNELLIGASYASPNDIHRSGETYVVFGRTEPFPPTLELASLDGETGFVIHGVDRQDFSGESVAGAGDLNGDGLDDLAIGAIFADPNVVRSAGESYVVFGSAAPYAAQLELSDLDGDRGFVVHGAEFEDYSGKWVAGAGDLDGDGIDDLVISATGADPNGQNGAGKAYVVFGRPTCTLPSQCGVARAAGARRSAFSALPSVSASAGGPVEDEYLVGDWDGDGCSDLAVRRGDRVLMSTDDDGFHDLEQVFGLGNDEDEYLVGDWNQDGCDDLAVRRGSEIHMDTNFDDLPDLVVDFAPVGTTEYLVGDLDGDGADDLVARAGGRLIGDLFPWDGIEDGTTEYGLGDGEGDYFIGHWSPSHELRQTFAVRRDRDTAMNTNFDRRPDFIQTFGAGDLADEYLIGDWDGDGRDNLATRVDNLIEMDVDFDDVADRVQQFGRGTE